MSIISKIYTPEELAQLWRVSTMTIYKMIHQGKIPHFRVGRAYRIPQGYLEVYMQQEGNLRSFGPTQSKSAPKAALFFLELLKKSSKEQKSGVLEIRLFGSYARGKASKDSDVDLIMIVRKLDSRTEHWISSLSEEAMAATDYKQLLSVFRVSAKHWEKHKALKSPLFMEIKRDGILLWPHSKS